MRRVETSLKWSQLLSSARQACFNNYWEHDQVDLDLEKDDVDNDDINNDNEDENVTCTLAPAALRMLEHCTKVIPCLLTTFWVGICL